MHLIIFEGYVFHEFERRSFSSLFFSFILIYILLNIPIDLPLHRLGLHSTCSTWSFAPKKLRITRNHCRKNCHNTCFPCCINHHQIIRSQVVVSWAARQSQQSNETALFLSSFSSMHSLESPKMEQNEPLFTAPVKK